VAVVACAVAVSLAVSACPFAVSASVFAVLADVILPSMSVIRPVTVVARVPVFDIKVFKLSVTVGIVFPIYFLSIIYIMGERQLIYSV
jgi:hypothetical protein